MRLIYVLPLLIIFNQLTAQNDGSLDEQYGVQGKIALLVPGTELFIHDAKINDDGSFVCTGKIKTETSADEDVIVVKVTADGELDKTFGTKGYVIFGKPMSEEVGRSIDVSSDGKILVAGWERKINLDIILFRINGDGSLDTGFDDDGMKSIDFGPTDLGMKIIALKDGQAMLFARTYSGLSKITLMKFNSDGSFDPTFGTNGMAGENTTNDDEYIYDACILDDGSIIIGGEGKSNGNSTFLIAKYDASGIPDNNFGNNGSTIYHVGQSFNGVYQMEKTADNGYALVGNAAFNSGSQWTTVKFNADGSVDESFGNNGYAATDPGNGDAYLKTLEAQADGKIVVGGELKNSLLNDDFGILRYNADGTIDETFGNGGLVYVDFNGGNEYLCQMETLEDHAILLVGSSGIIGESKILAAKINNNTPSKTKMQQKTPIAIVPNPLDSELTLRTAKPFEAIYFYNSLGQIVLHKLKSDFFSLDDSTYKLYNLDYLPTGLYFVKVTGSAMEESIKICKR